jgi:hypothetical protein
MTLHQAIINLNQIGFDIKFEPFISSLGTQSMTYVCLRFNGDNAVKVENRRLIDRLIAGDETALVAVIEDLYKEMKPYAIGHRTLHLEHD